MHLTLPCAKKLSVRPVVQAILHELLTRHRDMGRVHLNDITEVIAGRAVSYDEVEYLITQLEDQGLRVGETLDDTDIAIIHAVLDSARRLRTTLERRPTVDEIARDSSYPPYVVRRALEHAQSAARPKIV